jgi:hypothetical protein
MPKITCPYCRNTIGLDERREIDHGLILDTLKSGPKRFTDLYHATHLSKKTLSLRLKDLCEKKTVVKRGYQYCLNGAYRHQDGKNMFIRNMGRNFSAVTRNLRIVALLMLWLIPSATLAFALMTRPAEIKVVTQPPIASFTISPNPQPNTGWEVEGAKIISKTTEVSFNASSSSVADGYISQYIWEFGDGSSGSGVFTTHIYSFPGRYQAKLTVVDDVGSKDDAFKEVIVYSQPTATVYLQIPETKEIGSNITVYIMVASIENLYGWQTGLTFNPNTLECLSFEKADSPPDFNGTTVYGYTQGIFEGSEGASLWFPPRINNVDGVVSPAGCTLVGDTPPASGNGALAKVTFKVLSTGDLNIRLINVNLGSKNGEEIPVIVANP